MSWGVGCRRGSVSWHCCGLWCRLAATAPIRPLAWEPPYTTGVALKKQKTKKKLNYVTFNLCPHSLHPYCCKNTFGSRLIRGSVFRFFGRNSDFPRDECSVFPFKCQWSMEFPKRKRQWVFALYILCPEQELRWHPINGAWGVRERDIAQVPQNLLTRVCGGRGPVLQMGNLVASRFKGWGKIRFCFGSVDSEIRIWLLRGDVEGHFMLSVKVILCCPWRSFYVVHEGHFMLSVTSWAQQRG